MGEGIHEPPPLKLWFLGTGVSQRIKRPFVNRGLACQSTKDQAALQSFAETQLSGRRGAGLQVPSPGAPPIELGLTDGRPPAEGMLPFSLMSYVKGKEERKWRVKSQNSHNKNVIKVFSFLFKKVLKILNVASLQYILSVLTFSYVSIPAP